MRGERVGVNVGGDGSGDEREKQRVYTQKEVGMVLVEVIEDNGGGR